MTTTCPRCGEIEMFGPSGCDECGYAPSQQQSRPRTAAEFLVASDIELEAVNAFRTLMAGFGESTENYIETLIGTEALQRWLVISQRVEIEPLPGETAADFYKRELRRPWPPSFFQYLTAVRDQARCAASIAA